MNEIPSGYEDAFGALLSDIAWPVVHDAEGQEVQLTLANLGRFRASPERAVRQEAMTAFFATPHRHRWMLLLAASYYFYMCWKAEYVVLIVAATLINYLAFIVLTISGIDSFFNFNPLIKLDGYYLLSDWLEIPNLRARSFNYLMERLRWLLWGSMSVPSAPPPQGRTPPRGSRRDRSCSPPSWSTSRRSRSAA